VSEGVSAAQVTLSFDRRGLLRLAAFTAAVAAACAYGVVRTSDPQFLFCAIACGACVVALLLQACDGRAKVVCDAAGLDDLRTRRGPLPWAAMRQVRLAAASGGPVLLIDLERPERDERFLSRGFRPRVFRFLGLRADVYVPLGSLTPGPEVVLAFIRAQTGGAARTDPPPPSWRKR
jgi:hypothetical protein